MTGKSASGDMPSGGISSFCRYLSIHFQPDSSEYESYPAFGLSAFGDQRIDGVQRKYHGSLVVKHASAVHNAVLYFAQRFRRPTFAYRHRIDVSEYAEQVALSDLCPDVISVALAYGKTVRPCVFGNGCQTLRNAPAERTFGTRSGLHAVLPDESESRLHGFFERRVGGRVFYIHTVHFGSPPAAAAAYRIYIIYQFFRKSYASSRRRARKFRPQRSPRRVTGHFTTAFRRLYGASVRKKLYKPARLIYNIDLITSQTKICDKA